MDVGQSCALASRRDHPWQIKLRAQSITGLLFNNTKGRFKYCFQNCMHMRGGARMKKSQATKTSPMPSLLPEEDRLSWMSRLSRIIVILTPASVNVWVHDYHHSMIREALMKKKNVFFRALPEEGGGDPCPNLLTLFCTMFSLIFWHHYHVLILFGHF